MKQIVINITPELEARILEYDRLFIDAREMTTKQIIDRNEQRRTLAIVLASTLSAEYSFQHKKKPQNHE